MKLTRIFMAAVAALALAGCAKENQPDTLPVQDNAAEAAGKTITFEASLGTDAKTTLGDLADGKRPVYWESADKLAAVVGSSVVYSDLAVEADDENKKKCTFSIVAMTKPSETDNLIFFYPSQGASAAEGGVQFTLSSLQIGPADGLPKTSGSYNPLAAAVAAAGNALDVYENGGSSVTFRNVFGLLAFRFPSADIKQVVFEGNDNETVAGTYVITAEGALTDATSVSKSVTLKTSDGNAFKAGYTYYMAVVPQDFENGFTLTFTTTDGLTYQKTTDKPLELAASDIISLGEFKNAGITASRTVWNKLASNWYTEFTASGNIRNVAMDDKYVYLVQAGDPGVFAVDLMTGAYVKTLSVAGIANGTHLTSDANVIDSENGTKLIVCNLAVGKGGILKIYAYDSIDSDPKVLLTHTLEEAYRFGDHFTVEGTWESGRLLFYDFNQTGKVAVFTITEGSVSSTPQYMTLATKPGGTIGAMTKYPFNESEYMYAGAGGRMDVFSVSGLNATRTLEITDGGTFSNDIHGVSFFVVGGKKYMAHVGTYDSRKSGRIKVAELKGATLAESMNGITHPWNFYLAGDDASAIGAENGNAAGDAAFRVIRGKIYLAGNVPGSGIRVVELK